MITDENIANYGTKNALIQEAKDYLIPILGEQFVEVMPRHTFKDINLNMAYVRNIFCSNNRLKSEYRSEDEDLERLLVLHSLEKYFTFSKFSRQLNATHSMGLPVLHILYKSKQINGRTYGDFYRRDRELTSVERSLFEQYGEIPYFDRYKKCLDLVIFQNGRFETLDTFNSFRLVLDKSPSKYQKVGLQHPRLERRSVALKDVRR